ncbi:D-alanyl-D-alanine carboxypeptidase family protein [Streptomyces sp. NPDC018610]|uniref:D-alanyl-D-alanine carboxypeptidase family protein n=1 Tax=Streptomyces sp. NPDC018610 TaxID=3365049 RepID=UPI00379D391F
MSPRPSRRSLLALTAAPLAATAATAAAGAPAAADARAVGATAVGGARLARPGVQVSAATALPRGLTARAWLLADWESGEVLAAYRAHQRLAPASTLKMLFADTVLGRFARTDRHTVTEADLADIPDGSSLVGIQAGTTYTVEQLWQGVFLRSGNDAVHVLAAMNGGIPKTVAEMQARAADLQALDTHVVSPDGYDHPGQLSSAYDLTLFARHGLKNADFRGYCATRTADFPAGGRKTFQIQNTDRLLTGSWGLKTYDGMIGVKNGYTTHAGNTFAGAAVRGGRTLLVTVMHPAAGNNAVYEETAALLDWGFAQGRGAARAVGSLVEPLSEGGARAGGPSGQRAAGAAGGTGGGASGATAAEGPSTWRLLEGGGLTAALLAGGAWALRRRLRTRPAAAAAGSGPRRPGDAGLPDDPGRSGDPVRSGDAVRPGTGPDADSRGRHRR